MPRRKTKASAKTKKTDSEMATTPKRTLTHYFPPRPACSSPHNGVGKDCPEIKSEISVLGVLPTPENSPEKTPEKTVPVSAITKDVPQVKQDVDKKNPAAKGRSNPAKQNLVTDFFEVRKSSRRKTAKQIQRELESTIRSKIRQGCEDGLEVKEYEGKGRGVASTECFSRGDFVVEYIGQLMETKEARSREEEYTKDTSKGCYMYFFSHRNKRYCIDATAETGKLGRLLNHSRSKPNCVTKTVDLDDQPRLILVALRDITPGEELLYDYGDRSKEALESNPWLKD